jgi:hypothetical protein
VALNAKTHLKPFALYPVHGFHGPVAFLAGNVFLYMSLVIEQDVFR